MVVANDTALAGCATGRALETRRRAKGTRTSILPHGLKTVEAVVAAITRQTPLDSAGSANPSRKIKPIIALCAIRAINTIGAILGTLGTATSPIFVIPLHTVQTIRGGIARKAPADVGARNALDCIGRIEVVPEIALETNVEGATHRAAFHDAPTCRTLVICGTVVTLDA
jgi:hypothetical protein